MTNSLKRLPFLAVGAMALALMIAPVSFAGEDDDQGPTQVGEIQSGAGETPNVAEQTGPSEAAPSEAAPSPAPSQESAGSTQSKVGSAKVLGATHKASKQKVLATTHTSDVRQATGGVQAGFGGMATESSQPMTLALAGGILLILAAGFTQLRLRSQS